MSNKSYDEEKTKRLQPMDVVAPTPTESRLSEGYSEGVPSILPNRRFNLRRSERFGELI